ncbi:MAG: hypothetical protein IVW55_05270 [Chloroflexi bacterium]|nr:hypothetical protein [Chloroflexota bacterium]
MLFLIEGPIKLKPILSMVVGLALAFLLCIIVVNSSAAAKSNDSNLPASSVGPASITPLPLQLGGELVGFHFYIDPGHGGANAPGLPCQAQGTDGPAGTTERE